MRTNAAMARPAHGVAKQMKKSMSIDSGGPRRERIKTVGGHWAAAGAGAKKEEGKIIKWESNHSPEFRQA